VQTVRVGESMDGNLRFTRYAFIEWTSPDEAVVAKLRRKFGSAPGESKAQRRVSRRTPHRA
jgi:hypothetical protein